MKSQSEIRILEGLEKSRGKYELKDDKQTKGKYLRSQNNDSRDH